MQYEEFDRMVTVAWSGFFNILEYYGLDRKDAHKALNRKDCYNEVFDALISIVEIESEDE